MVGEGRPGYGGDTDGGSGGGTGGGGGGGGDGQDGDVEGDGDGDGLNWWEDNLSNLILGTEPNTSLAYDPGLELHQPIMSTPDGHGGRIEREREIRIINSGKIRYQTPQTWTTFIVLFILYLWYILWINYPTYIF